MAETDQAIDRPDAEHTIVVEAPAEHVWHLVSDVTRTGEWSPACRSCDWADGAAGPALGAEFVGHNRLNGFRWSRRCRVTASEPGRDFAFSTYFKGRESTRWRYRLEPAGYGRTRVTESYQVVSTPAWVKLLRLLPGAAGKQKRDLVANLEQSLRRLKHVAEAEVGTDREAKEG